MNTLDTFDVIYNVVSGPLVWAAFVIFIGGSLYRLWKMFALINKKDRFIYTYMSLSYSLRSIGHWILPFGTTSWRMHPAMTVATFAFHICLILLPIFLTGHVVMIAFSWGASWPTLPAVLADVMTVIVIACCIFFLVRRIVQKEVKYLTTPSDFVLLLITVAPFITGFFAYHQWLDYRTWITLHILSGEIMLVAIPFTRLSHMLFAVFTRSYLASEFGGVRCAKDW